MKSVYNTFDLLPRISIRFPTLSNLPSKILDIRAFHLPIIPHRLFEDFPEFTSECFKRTLWRLAIETMDGF